MFDLDSAFRMDVRKAIEAIVYIASRAPRPDLYHVCKIMYFADKLHLERYGRLVCGDNYVAMSNGPVPSGIYDLLKDVRDGREHSAYYGACVSAYMVAGDDGDYKITSLREPNLDVLSESEVECIDLSIAENGALEFSVLKDKSHDGAYGKADLNDDIPLEAIIDTLPAAEDIKHHIREGLLV